MKEGEKMNIENDYVTGYGEVTFTNSLNAPLIYLKLKVDSNTVIPDIFNLIIYIDQSSKNTPSQNRKTYVYSLPSQLSLNSEFIIDSKIENNYLSMRSYINVNDTITELEYQPINLFSGVNYIYTNYDNIFKGVTTNCNIILNNKMSQWMDDNGWSSLNMRTIV